MSRVLLYSRPGCHLCDEAREVLERLRGEGRCFGFEEVDIESDDHLLKRYLERIPVVEINGVVVSELVPDENGMRVALDTVGT